MATKGTRKSITKHKGTAKRRTPRRIAPTEAERAIHRKRIAFWRWEESYGKAFYLVLDQLLAAFIVKHGQAPDSDEGRRFIASEAALLADVAVDEMVKLSMAKRDAQLGEDNDDGTL